MGVTRNIVFDGESFALVGREGDSYFENAAPDQPFSYAIGKLTPGSVVFDVGANIGMTAVISARKAEKVYAFEPDPTVFGLLEKTVAANGGAVETLNTALGDQEGQLSFFSNSTSASASHLVTAATLGQREATSRVPVTTVDAFVKHSRVERLDLIKIDVEGFEIDVLRGASESIQRFKPAALVEFNAFTMVGFRDVNPRDLLRLLRETFPNVYRFKAGAPVAIGGDDDALAFIHDNLVSAGCVDDLYCSF